MLADHGMSVLSVGIPMNGKQYHFTPFTIEEVVRFKQIYPNVRDIDVPLPGGGLKPQKISRYVHAHKYHAQ